MQVVVSASGASKLLIVKAVLSIHLAKLVADTFTDARKDENELQKALVATYGDRNFRWYCIDQSGVDYRITFSNEANPRLFMYQGAPAAIANTDSDMFVVNLAEADTFRPGRLNPHEIHKHYISQPIT